MAKKTTNKETTGVNTPVASNNVNPEENIANAPDATNKTTTTNTQDKEQTANPVKQSNTVSTDPVASNNVNPEENIANTPDATNETAAINTPGKEQTANPEEQLNIASTEPDKQVETKAQKLSAKVKRMQDIAAQHLVNYPNSNKIFATEDGNFWLDSDESHARAYAAARKMKLHEFICKEKEVKNGE